MFLGTEDEADGLYGKWFESDRLTYDKDEQAIIDDHLMFKLNELYPEDTLSSKEIKVKATDPVMPKTTLSE